jgi:hypothetical protein
MMAGKLTASEVFNAAERLLARGELPTVGRIRVELRSKGSPEIVSQLLDKWWHVAIQRMAGQLPELPRPVVLAFSQIWQQALTAARAESVVEGERAGLAAIQHALRESDDQQVEILERAHAEADAAREAATQSEFKIADLQKRLYLQAYEVAELRAQRDAERLRASELEMGLARLREELARRLSTSKAKTKGRNSPPRAKREATPRGKADSEIAKTRKAPGRRSRNAHTREVAE